MRYSNAATVRERSHERFAGKARLTSGRVELMRLIVSKDARPVAWAGFP